MDLTPSKRSFRYSLGERGESAAGDYLAKQGYEIRERNYRSATGEIDLIAKKDDRICFFEVKTRSNDKLGHPEEAVNLIKQKKIIKVAESYLKSCGLENSRVSFHVLSILWPEGMKPSFKLIEDAFGETGRDS